MSILEPILTTARACRICEAHLDPRPVLRLHPDARVVIIGQAPGSRVHATGVPWDDASGDHLRAWLDVDRATFDDPRHFGILPMGLCYPGKGSGGDLPPPRVCAETWHPPLLDALPRRRLVLLVGRYALARYLPSAGTVTDAVRGYRDHLPGLFPLPHPSWRSKRWMQQHPWFEADVLPTLRHEVRRALQDPTSP